MNDYFFYNGTVYFSLDDFYYNILKGRILHYNLHEYINLTRHSLSIFNNNSNWNTRLEVVLDILNFINKNGQITNDSIIPVIYKNPSTKENEEFGKIISINRKLYLYSLNPINFKEIIIPIYEAFIRQRKTSRYRFTYLSEHIVNKDEKRMVKIKNELFPLFEAFMKAKLHLSNGLYKATEKNLLLECGGWKSICYACEHRLRNITNNGCESCTPIMLKNPREKN